MNTKTTRRDFIKSSAIAASAAVASQAFISQSAHAAGSDIIRIGMIGCGGRCTGAAGNAMEADPGTRLVAMCDLFMDRIQARRKALQASNPKQVLVDDDHCFAGLDGYKHVIESCDVILAANAANFHPFHLRAGIDAGKHVFLEKPHAIDPPGVREITAACELAKQKKLSVLSGLHSRFWPTVQETVKRIHDGQIGRVVTIEENFLRGPYGTLYRDPKLSELHYQYSNQYRFAWLSGDDVPQSLIHNLDRATWVLNEQTPIACHGLGGRSSSCDIPHIYGNVFDHHSVVYHYADGTRIYALCRTQKDCYNEDDSIVIGTKGVADLKRGKITGENPWQFSGPNPDPYVEEHRAFFRAIRSNEPINCGDYMARSTLVGVMGQISCYSGKAVTWEQAKKSDFRHGPTPQQCTWDMEPPVKPGADGLYPVAIPGQHPTA